LLSLAALALAPGAVHAQSLWDTSVRLAPSYYSYDIKAPFSEKISEVSFPLYALMPIMPWFSMDIGTAFASAHVENTAANTKSDISGLTDTQVRANYTFGEDFFVLTAGVNLPTGSATVEAAELAAATRIGSDFLS